MRLYTEKVSYGIGYDCKLYCISANGSNWCLFRKRIK